MISQDKKLQNTDQIQVTQESIASAHKTQETTQTSDLQTQQKLTQDTTQINALQTQQEQMQTQSVTGEAVQKADQGELKQVIQRINDNMPPAYKKPLTKSEARKAGENMVRINQEYEGFLAENSLKYITKDKLFNVTRALKDYLVKKSGDYSVPKFSDAELKKQPVLNIYNKDIITFDSQEISETDKRLALFNTDDAIKKLPIRKQAGFKKKMEAYRKARVDQAKAYNKIKSYNSVVTEGKQLMENAFLKKEQKLAAADMVSYAGNLTEKDFTEYGPDKLSEAEQKVQDEIAGFAKWRVENDLLLTSGDRRWKEYRKFAETFDDQKEAHRIIRITFGTEIREISVLDGQYLGDGELNLTATSAEELERMCDDVQKMNEHYRNSLAAKQYSDSKKDTDKAVKGTFKLEFDAMTKLQAQSATDLYDRCFNADKPEVIQKVVVARLKEFEQARDYKGAADYMIECTRLGSKNEAYTDAFRQYLQELSGEIEEMKNLKQEIPAEEEYMIAVVDRLNLLEVRSRYAAGKSMAAMEERIKKGEIEGCELLSKKEIKKAAHDIIHYSKEGVAYNRIYNSYSAIYQFMSFGLGSQLNRSTSKVLYNHRKAMEKEVIREEMEKDPSLTEKEIIDILARAASPDLELRQKSFVMKDNWNGEGSPFAEVPEDITEAKNAQTDKLYEKKSELENMVAQAKKYETEVGNTVSAYRQNFAILKSLGIDFRTAPPEYVDLYKAFDNVQRLGVSYNYKHNKHYIIKDGMFPKMTEAALSEIKLAAEKFLSAQIKVSSKDRSKYEDLREILSSTLKFTEGEQARYKEIHKTFTKSVSVILNEDQEVLDRINRELIFRGEKDVVIAETVKPRFAGYSSREKNEIRSDTITVMELISKMKTSNSRVFGGSSEFDKALEGAITMFEIGDKASDTLLYGTPEEFLKATGNSAAVFDRISKSLEAYLARKRKQGKSDKVGDEKSKERISYVMELEEKLKNIRENIESARNKYIQKKENTDAKEHKEFIEKLLEEGKKRWDKLDAGDQQQPQEELDPIAQKYQASLEEFNNDHFDDIQELKDELALIREKEAEYDDAIRDLRSNWAPESKLKELRTKKYREISKLKDAYKAKVKSKNLYDFGQSVNYDTLDPASYTEELKEHYSKVLKDRGCRVGRSRAANVEFRGKYFMNDPVALDYVWRPGVEQEIKDAYEWLVQYYTVHDTTREKRNEVKQRPVKRKIPKYKMDLSDIDQIVREYEKQPAGTNNCFACAGAEMYRQFCRKEGRLSKPVTQFDIRKYRPRFKTFDEYKKEVEELEPSIDREVYNRYYKETNSYIVGGSVGNIYELGDFFISKQKDAALKKTTLHVPALTKEMTEEQKKDRNVVYNNTKAAFLDKVFEGLSGGHIVTVLTSHPMRHYRTIVGINGEKIKYVDSLGSAHGALQTANVGDLFLPGDGEALNVELVWMEKARNEELKAEYKTLEMNKDGKMYNSDPGIEDIAMLAQTKGVSVSKKLEEQKNDGVHMRECVYLSKSI